MQSFRTRSGIHKHMAQVSSFWTISTKTTINTTLIPQSASIPAVFLEPLAGLLQPQATILDIGCGSGRDLLWFAGRGFRPTGFEQSPSLANLARKHSNCPVMEGDFSRFNFSDLHYSALVFVGSLVHLSPEALPVILASTCQALSPGGLLLITLKGRKRHFPCCGWPCLHLMVKREDRKSLCGKQSRYR
jgi:SAM-dependent methyltransferase